MKQLPTGVFSSTGAFQVLAVALVRNIPTRAFIYSAFLARTSITPGTAVVVCTIFSPISSQLFEMMHAAARTGTHVRSGHFQQPRH